MRSSTFAAFVAVAQGVTPTQKVIQLLQDMMAKGKEEMRAEEVKFSAFVQWCDNTKASKSEAIQREADAIASLESEVDKLQADCAQLSRQISSLDEAVEQHKTDAKAATEVRGKEAADFQATYQDYTETLDSLDGAIATMKSGTVDGFNFLQLSRSKIMPADVMRVIASFAQSGDEVAEAAAPEAHYNSHLGGIIDMLKELKAKFKSERTELEKEELTRKHEFEMMTSALHDEAVNDSKTSGRKTATRAKKEKRIAEAGGELAEEQDDMSADKKYLADLEAECAAKTSDFDSRQQLRTEELAAIGKAVDILDSDSVSQAAEQHLPGMLQKGTAFLSLRASAKAPTMDKVQHVAGRQLRSGLLQVAAYLQEAAERTGSQELQTAANSAESAPFEKVKKMITEMIVKLKEEANEEAEHSAWCDTELTTNKQTRSDKSSEIEELNSDIEGLQASNSKLSIEVSELQVDIQNLESERSRASEDRTAEKAKNQATISDAKEAQAAVSNALAVLKEFYDKASEASALVQGAPDDAPETFTEPYKGMQGQSGGVLGMLEVILSDFARLEEDTTASEAAAQEEYKTFMSDSKTDLATKNADVKGKTDKITRQDESISQTRESLAATEKELDAAQEYYEKLKPGCVSGGVNYDDRVKQREAEVQSLKEALKILNGDDIPMPIESGRSDYATGASHQGE
mmetsp:Transcript_124681/g.285621  ORF Transcript_124681/g.285621 Transcript_124681/m.285621 type:complete len:689 (+) Transcript_124681:77-2143(+)